MIGISYLYCGGQSAMKKVRFLCIIFASILLRILYEEIMLRNNTKFPGQYDVVALVSILIFCTILNDILKLYQHSIIKLVLTAIACSAAGNMYFFLRYTILYSVL